LRRGGDMRIVERGVETRPSMPGGPECHLLVGVARVGNEVVIGADNCIDVDEVFRECRLSGARVSHKPHSADKRTHCATTSFASQGSNRTLVSRAAVVRRSEPRRFFLANADERGGFQGAKRSERSEQSDNVRAGRRVLPGWAA
jgi:hypothetical protein